ncbi:MAG: hypothetical protein AB1403_04200 [Candidatus Riflebacteria bacterium]
MDNEISVYVQSAGSSNEFDYSWQSQNEQKIPANILSLISTDLESALYFRFFQGKDWLVLTNLHSTIQKRCDFTGTRLRNSVAWTAEKSNHQQLLALLKRYLFDKKKLETEVDGLIFNDDSEKCGFRVDFSSLADLDKDSINLVDFSTKNLDYSLRLIAADNSSNRERFFERLKNIIVNKVDSGVLFLLSKFQTNDSFEEINKTEGLWLGLSEQVSDSVELRSHKKKTEISTESSHGSRIEQGVLTAFNKIEKRVGKIFQGVQGFFFNSDPENKIGDDETKESPGRQEDGKPKVDVKG